MLKLKPGIVEFCVLQLEYFVRQDIDELNIVQELLRGTKFPYWPYQQSSRDFTKNENIRMFKLEFLVKFQPFAFATSVCLASISLFIPSPNVPN